MIAYEDLLLRLPPWYQWYRRQLREFAPGSGADIGRFQDSNLDVVLRRARALPQQPYGSFRQLADLPTLPKDAVRARPEAYLRRTLLPTSNKHTSGTTGTALEVRRSLQSVVFEQAAVDWVVRQAGIDFRRARVAVLRGSDIKAPDDQKPPFWRFERGGRHLVFSSNHLSRRTFPAVHEALRGFRPDVIYAYPSVADQLVRHAEALGCRLRCPLVLTSSEALPANLRRRVANGLGAQVVDIYGQAERVAFAYSVEPDVYRFVPAYSLVELVPGPSEGEFEIVGTPFHNAAQVFVRYATGDRIELDDRAPDLRRLCEGAATFRGISGRLNDVLYGPGGEVFVGIDHIPRGLTDVGRFQFIQEAPDFIRVLVDGTESPGQAATVLQRARMKLPTAMRVEIEFVPELQRTEAGKVPFVIHNHRPAGPPTPT